MLLRSTRPFDPRFLDALEARVVGDWSGTAWRQVFAGTDPHRPNVRGARWNPPEVEALYCSLDPATANAEIEHIISRQPIPIQAERITFSFSIRLTRAVDLRDLNSLHQFGVTLESVTQEDPTIPRHVGGAVAWLQCGGLLVPSARYPGINLVIYPNNLAAADRVEVVSPQVYRPDD